MEIVIRGRWEVENAPECGRAEGHILAAYQHDIAWSVKVCVGIELPDHDQIGCARLIAQLLPAESAYLSLQVTVAGLGREVALHVRWLARLHKVLIESFGICIDKNLRKGHGGSAHHLGRHSSLSLSHYGEIDN